LNLADLGLMEKVFLSLWLGLSVLYWLYYRTSENPLGALLKVGALFGFVYLTMKGVDWLAHEVPAAEVITLGLTERPPEGSFAPRIPALANAGFYLVLALLAMVVWYGRHKFSTIGSLILSTWDRGHWYMLPVVFILLTIGLLLVAAAASPVLSPFIYTIF